MQTTVKNLKDKDIENFISVLLKYKEKITKTPNSSKKFLIDLGVMTKKGNLTKHYREICTPEGRE